MTIVDYGVGNLASIQNMFKRIGVDALITNDQIAVQQATKLILPGVGAFDTCAQRLKDSGLLSIINSKVNEDKVPVLGLCVGMQLLFEGSEEGELPGLGWIKGKNIRFRTDQMSRPLKVPHMGWTNVSARSTSRLLKDIVDPRFYFVHSFHAQLEDQAAASIDAAYGYPFVAGVEKGNILGVQFHPEKSHHFGMQLFKNFVTLY
jgi:glutamine amidotransferase